MNIMRRLLSIVLLAAVPIGVLQAVSVHREQQEEQVGISRMAAGIASQVAAEQRRIAEGGRQLLTALAQLPSVRDRSDTQCNLIFRRLKAHFAIYTAIGVADASGRVWCSSAQPGVNLSDRPYFHRAIAARRFTTGGYVLGRVSGRRTLNFSFPFFSDRGALEGVLILGLDLDRLAADLGRAKLPPSSSLAIFGPDGRALVDLPGGTRIGGSLPTQFQAAFRAKTPGILHTNWLDGSDRVVGFVPPAADPAMPFLVLVGIDRAQAMGAVEANGKRDMTLLLAVLTGALLLAWWVAARYVRRPVRRLAGAVRAWREGNSEARVGPLDRGSEFNDLAQAFDALADTLEERQRGLRDALESTTDLVVALGADWTFRYLNGRALAYVDGRDVIGSRLWDVFPEISDKPVGDALRRAMAERRPLSVAFEHEGLGGRFETNAFPARDGGLTLYSRNVTEQHRAQAELRRLALNDPLTDLPNRTHALEIASQKAADGLLSAMLLLDLDNFKHVNDSDGHPAGDAMLREVARRVSAALEAEGVVARLGGDEFVILLFEASPSRCVEVGNRLLAALERTPFLVRGRLHPITASAGLVLVQGDSPRGVAPAVEELMANADIALYRAKAAGGGTCHLFSAADGEAYQARRRLEEEVAAAAASGQFELHFQPQVRLADGAPVGAEALLRWRHPRRGLLLPNAFIDVLETSRHALSVGAWIIDEACRCAALWRREGAGLRVAVNLFGQQARSRDLASVVAAALAKHGLPPEALELEVTENIALAAEAETRATLRALRVLGVGLALDDFGTGFASLTTLKSLPVDRLKIDRGFVAQLPSNAHDRAIVEAVLALAGTLGLEVVAEGVETAEQEAYLRARGCQEAQGYLFGRPVPAWEFRIPSGSPAQTGS
jgi:diguanylate cyclase (GGDEF)-like protein